MQRCVFCQAEFEEGAESCPACGQKPPAADLETPPLLESLSSTEPLPEVLPVEGAASEEAVSSAAPGGEQESLDEHDLPTSPDNAQPVAEAESDPQSELTPLPSDDETASQGGQPTFQDQIPVLAASSPEATGARSTKLWRKSYVRVLAIILTVIVVVAGSGAAFYFVTLPRPVLNVSGPRQVGSNPAGSPDQVFHVSGQKFSANSAITFLLDGKAAPGAPKVKSDNNGNFTAVLPITDDWLVGSHSLTAKDAKGYVTHTAQQVQILPAPVLVITSKYQQGAIPVGSAGTSFHLSAKRFPLKVSITLLVDNQPLPGGSFSSDARGRLETDLTVSSDMSVGTHTITARDAQGDTTASGAPLAIVQQGDAGTPGPNDAPANDASFSIVLGGGVIFSPPGFTGTFQDQLNVTGQPDPAGGSVCGSNDDGQPQTIQLQNPDGSVFMTITETYGCSGTYKYGHLIYTETVISIEIKFLSGFLSGATCTGGGYTYRQLEGTFSNATTISGTARYPDAPPIPCDRDGAITMFSMGPPGNTWTGTVEVPQG